MFIRMKIENATLKESMESMERLTSSIHRLRLSLLKVSILFCFIFERDRGKRGPYVGLHTLGS